MNISVFDINGRLVDELFSGYSDAGHNSVNWDASNNTSGVYLVKFISGNNIHTQKLMLVK
jgi:hypothetical protein